MESPARPRRPLEGERFQVIVVGGGINGIAIARECARAGRRTLLLEQNDFGSGTSTRTGRVITGGLKYIAKKEIGIAREILREQEYLLRSYPHLVHRSEFLHALNPKSGRSSLKLRTGLWLYKQMRGTRSESGAKTSDIEKLTHLLPDPKRWSVFNYEEAICQFPERLVAEWLLEAVEFGAVARNYTQVLAVDVRHDRAQGVFLRDQLSGREERVDATCVVNATGAWADRLCHRSRIQTHGPMLSPVKSSHLVISNFPGMPETAICTEEPDGTEFFVVPWNGQILAGSTEIPDNGDPTKTAPTQEDIDILLGSLQALIPRAQITAKDIRYVFSGMKSRPFSSNAVGSSEGYVVREHAQDGAANLISALGGDLTTARRIAFECLAAIGGKDSFSENTGTSITDFPMDRWIVELTQGAKTSEQSASAIAEWHGKRSSGIAQIASTDVSMRNPLCSHTEHIVAEAFDAFKSEHAMSLADVLLRRVPVALGPCWSQTCGREAVTRIRAVMGWSEQTAAAELEAFEIERASLLRKPAIRPSHWQAAAD